MGRPQYYGKRFGEPSRLGDDYIGSDGETYNWSELR